MGDSELESTVLRFFKQFDDIIDPAVESYDDVDLSKFFMIFQTIFGDNVLPDFLDADPIPQMHDFLLQNTPREQHPESLTLDDCATTAVLLFRCAQSQNPPAFKQQWEAWEDDGKEFLMPREPVLRVFTWADLLPTLTTFSECLRERNVRVEKVASLDREIAQVRLDISANTEGVAKDTKSAREKKTQLESEIAELRAKVDGQPKLSSSIDTLRAEKNELTTCILNLESTIVTMNEQLANLEELRRVRDRHKAKEAKLAKQARDLEPLQHELAGKEEACVDGQTRIAALNKRTEELKATVKRRVALLKDASKDAEFQEKIEMIKRLRKHRDDLKQRFLEIRAQSAAWKGRKSVT